MLRSLSRIGAVYVAAFGATIFSAEPPRMLFQHEPVVDEMAPRGEKRSLAFLRLPNGQFAFYDRNHPSTRPIQLPDRDGRLHALRPPLPEEAVHENVLRSKVLENIQVVMTPDKKLINVFVKSEAIDKPLIPEIGLPLYLNVWMKSADSISIDEPKMIWRGYNGSQMEYEQLPSGRLIVPFGSYQPHAKAKPPTGRHQVVVQYSDDLGKRWNESESKLISPCYAGFNGSNEGACEPAIERLKDGRLWMLFRTQAGFLYESYSSDSGTTWTPATASRFSTSTGPPNILRFRDGMLVVCWNNCEMPPRANGQGVYGGRDALHMAVSHDEGKTWQGFREIYLDYRRNENPAKSGDRGTAYPLAAYTDDGKIIVISGQGLGGRNPIVIDPAWIAETEVIADFSNGLNDWSTYKHHGPAQGWWRARAVGGELVDEPTATSSVPVSADKPTPPSTSRCLRLRKADELPADGAVWNFPNAWSGSLRTTIWIDEASRGGSIALNDRMFDPSNDDGERLAIFRIDFAALDERDQRPDSSPSVSASDETRVVESLSTTHRHRILLKPNTWHDIEVCWNLFQPNAELKIDSQPLKPIPLLNKTLNGISYVRFRSAAKDMDSEGFIVRHVAVNIDNPFAPPASAQELREHEARYIQNVVSHWSKNE